MRDAAVAAEAFAEGVGKSDDGEWQSGDGEDSVRRENREIHRANPALAAEANDPDVKMKIQVEGEKRDGAEERGDHGNFVVEDFTGADECETDQQEKSADAIKDCVEFGKR